MEPSRKKHKEARARIGTLRRFVFPRKAKHFLMYGLPASAWISLVRLNNVREATYNVVLAAVSCVNRMHTLMKSASPWRPEIAEFSADMTKAE